MKKILITSANFSGEIQVVYGEDLLLMTIDFSYADCSPEQISWTKLRVPAVLDAQFQDAFAGAKSINIVMEGYEVTFEMFWQAYGEKINKIRCEKRWEKLSKADRQKAFAGVAKYLKHLAKNSWQNKANPDTYLMNKYWLNEWK